MPAETALPLLAPFRPVDTAGINHVAFSPDSRLMAQSDTSMRLSVMRDGTEVFSLKLSTKDDKIRPTERIRGLSFSHDGSLLFVAAGDRLHAFDVSKGIRAWSYRAPRSFGFLIISPIAVASSLGLVASAFDNGTLGVWTEAGSLKSLWHDNDSPRYIGFLPDGDRLVGSDSFSVRTWNVATRKKEARFRLPQRVYSLAASPSVPVVAFRTLHDLILFDCDELRILHTLPVGSGLPLAALHPCEALVAVGDRHGFNLVDFSGALKERHTINDCRLLSLAFKPDGSAVVAGCSDRSVREFAI